MFKVVIIFVIILAAAGFVVSQVPSLKQRVIEIINPRIKEGQILGEMKTNLDNIGSALGDLNSIKDPAALSQIQKSKDLLQKSKDLLNSVTRLNQNNSGIIQQTIGGIINAITDNTPYPADHLPTTSASPSPVYTCPPR